MRRYFLHQLGCLFRTCASIALIAVVIGSRAVPIMYGTGTVYAQSDTTLLTLLTPPFTHAQIDSGRTRLSTVCNGCSLSDPANVSDSTTSNYATLFIPTGVGHAGTIAVLDDTATYGAGSFAGFVLSDQAATDAHLLNALTIRTYNNGVLQDAGTATTIIDTPVVPGQRVIGIATTHNFDEVSITASALASTPIHIRVFYAFVRAPDTTAPTIVSVTSTTPNDTYGLGANILLTVTLSEPVVGGSRLVLTLDTGAMVTLTCFTSQCTTLRGSSIVFTGANNTHDLSVIIVTGRLEDAAGNVTNNPSIPAGNNLADSADIAISTMFFDTHTPAVVQITSTTPAATYGVGANIDIRADLSKVVLATTSIQAALNTGDTVTLTCTNPICATLSGTLTIGAGGDKKALSVQAFSGNLTDLVDHTTTPLVPAAHNLDANAQIVVDTTMADLAPPWITTITSTNPDGDYSASSAINITVGMSELVAANSQLRLTLATGDTVMQSCMTSACTSLSGTYIVRPNDAVADLTITAIGGTLTDLANNSTTMLALPNGRNLSDNKRITIGSPDTDNNGVPDAVDLDDDGDGMSDTAEGNGSIDTDGDGTPDSRDSDSDNDGVPDAVERLPTDTDGDGIANYRDNDDDNDDILTQGEDRNGNDNPTDDDADKDGIPDYLDPDPVTDFDGDSIPDNVDTDDDNDTMPDIVEGDGAIDTDKDGTPDSRDANSDNDGIPDRVEAAPDPISSSSAPVTYVTEPVDTDTDGTPDFRDTDSDNDGIADRIEGMGDADGDRIANYRDSDSDGDGMLDELEGIGDSDSDGVPNYLDPNSFPSGVGFQVYVPIVLHASYAGR